MYVGVLPVCLSVYLVHANCMQTPEESVRCLGTGVSDSCELPYEC